jgi:hypothetical protein
VLLLPAGKNRSEVQERDIRTPGFLTQPLREFLLHFQGMEPSLVLQDGFQGGDEYHCQPRIILPDPGMKPA